MVTLLAFASTYISRLGMAFIRALENTLVVMSSGASLVLRQKASYKVIVLAIAFACLSGIYNIVTFYERSLGFEQLDIRLCWLVRMCSPLKNDPGPVGSASGGSAPPPPTGAPSGGETSVGDGQKTTIAPVSTGTDNLPVESSTIVKPNRFIPDPDKAALREFFRQLVMSDRALRQKYPDLAAEIAKIQRQPIVGAGVARCTLLLSARSSSLRLMIEEIVQGEAVSPDRDQAMLADQACADAIENAVARIKERARG